MTDTSMIESREIPCPVMDDLVLRTRQADLVDALKEPAAYAYGYHMIYITGESTFPSHAFFRKKIDLIKFVEKYVTSRDRVVAIIRGKEVPYRVQTRLSL